MVLPELRNLGNSFKENFEIMPAYSQELKNEVYRVRHQVYCEDLKFEPERADRYEMDAHDANSLHLLMRSVKTGDFIGCTRLVRPPAKNLHEALPFEVTCADSLDRSIVDPATLPRDSLAEVSRLAVVARYRRRKGEEQKPISISDEDFGTPNQPRFPYIPIGLYLATAELARLNGIDNLFVLTEERLAAHFVKLGFQLQFIGSAVEHHGKRVPSMMSVRKIIDGMRPMLRPLYEIIADDIRTLSNGENARTRNSV